MNNFLDFYQHIPEKINPEIMHFGFFSVGWYALMYAVALLVVWLLLKKRLQLFEDKKIFSKLEEGRNISAKNKLQKKQEVLLDFLLFCFFGVIIGGRLGYVFFYNFPFYSAHPLAIISPFDLDTGKLIGIYGMSYHGGLLGVLIAAWIFIKKYKINFWALADFIIPVIPAGYFFGRIGNFLNGELYGRVTVSRFGMYFPADPTGVLRYPSQLYEAFLEGFLLFIFFWFWRNYKSFSGKFLALYLIGYAGARFAGEFFREPDPQIGFIFGNFTLGQIFSLAMFFGGLILLFLKKNKKPLLPSGEDVMQS
ncbi:MAG: prolipoprotein diacylglyceryl transferase [Parcubacteria group bacterium]|jgi:phosphatidylglycerol:prolipoprotein diacylglycerol transferase